MTGSILRRSTLPLTHRDEAELTLLRQSETHRNMLAKLSSSSTLPEDVSEAVILHAVFEIGLRTVLEALEEKGYAEIAIGQESEEPNKYATARRHRPAWADEE